MNEQLSQTDWSPERKLVGAAIAILVAGIVTTVTGVEVFPGAEGALGIVVAYFLPNKK